MVVKKRKRKGKKLTKEEMRKLLRSLNAIRLAHKHLIFAKKPKSRR